MDKILHDPKDPKLWELWYIPYYGSCRILSISRILGLIRPGFLNQVPTFETRTRGFLQKPNRGALIIRTGFLLKGSLKGGV